MEIDISQIFYNIYKNLPIGPRPDIWSQIELSLDRMSGRDLSISRLPEFEINGIVHFEKCKQLFEYQHFLLLTDIRWSKFLYIFKCCSFFSTPVFIRHLWRLKTVVFLHWCLICTVLFL
jgi:hypothetical protein